MAEQTIRYLIKFCSREKYADDLVDGKLFMNAAGYYHYLEEGQGDSREGALSSTHCIFKNLDRPVYCMYVVFDKDIIDGEIHIPEQIMKDFHCEDGWAVLIEFTTFEKAITSLGTNGYELKGGLVMYGGISDDGTAFLMTDMEDKQLFIKRSSFAYQQEFRLVVSSSLGMRTIKTSIDGVECQMVDSDRPYDSITYELSGNATFDAKKIAMASLHATPEGDLLIPLNA